MAKLTSNQRKKMPASEFAGPGKSYPVPDKAHAANAKARATQQVKKGNLTSAQKAKIDAAANKKLGKSDNDADDKKPAKKAAAKKTAAKKTATKKTGY